MKNLIYIFLSVAFLFSCNKGIVEPNPRDLSIGSYSYQAKTYTVDFTSGQLSYLGSDFDFTGTFEVAATPAGEDDITIAEPGNMLSVKNLTRVENGFAFDFDNQAYAYNGKSYTITGYQGVAVTTEEGKAKTYDGRFSTDTKKMQFYFQTTEQAKNIIFEFNLTKGN